MFTSNAVRERLDRASEHGLYRIERMDGGAGYVVIVFPEAIRIVETGAGVSAGSICEPGSAFVDYARRIYEAERDQLVFVLLQGSIGAMFEARECLRGMWPDQVLTIGLGRRRQRASEVRLARRHPGLHPRLRRAAAVIRTAGDAPDLRAAPARRTSRRMPDFAGVALVDILANGVAILIIVIVVTIAARMEREERYAEQADEIAAVMSHKFSTSLVLNSLAASPPARLHDYDASPLDQVLDPDLLPILELHPGFVREFYSGTIWTRRELLEAHGGLGAWLAGFSDERKSRLRVDVYDIPQFYLTMSILREHGIRVFHWHFLAGALSPGEAARCPPGVAAKDCPGGGEAPAPLPRLTLDDAGAGGLAGLESPLYESPSGGGHGTNGAGDSRDSLPDGSGAGPGPMPGGAVPGMAGLGGRGVRRPGRDPGSVQSGTPAGRRNGGGRRRQPRAGRRRSGSGRRATRLAPRFARGGAEPGIRRRSGGSTPARPRRSAASPTRAGEVASPPPARAAGSRTGKGRGKAEPDGERPHAPGATRAGTGRGSRFASRCPNRSGARRGPAAWRRPRSRRCSESSSTTSASSRTRWTRAAPRARGSTASRSGCRTPSGRRLRSPRRSARSRGTSP